MICSNLIALTSALYVRKMVTKFYTTIRLPFHVLRGAGLRIRYDILRFSWRAVLTSVVFYISSQPREAAPQNWGVQSSEAAPNWPETSCWSLTSIYMGLVSNLPTPHRQNTSKTQLTSYSKKVSSSNLSLNIDVCAARCMSRSCSQHGPNSLWLINDAIGRHRSGSKLAYVMALVPGGTKPLPEPILSYHQRCSVVFP